MHLHTRFTQAFDLTTPIALAPLALSSGGALSAACAHAGAHWVNGGGGGRGVCGVEPPSSASSPSGWSLGTPRWSGGGGPDRGGSAPHTANAPHTGNGASRGPPSPSGYAGALAAARAALQRVEALEHCSSSEHGFADDDRSLYGYGSAPSARGLSATSQAAEERIVAAAAAAAGAVIASECIKWRARADRLEAERAGQLAQQQELFRAIRAKEVLFQEAEGALQAVRQQVNAGSASTSSKQREEYMGQKEALQRERHETLAAEAALAGVRRELAELETALVAGEDACTALEAELPAEGVTHALAQRTQQAEREAAHHRQRLASMTAALEEKRARQRVHSVGGTDDNPLAPQHRAIEELEGEVERARVELAELRRAIPSPSKARGAPPSMELEAARDLAEAAEAARGIDFEEEEEVAAAEDSLRRQLAAIKRERREHESLRCVWRQSAWQAAWAILALTSRIHGGAPADEQDSGATSAEAAASEVISSAKEEVDQEADHDPSAGDGASIAASSMTGGGVDVAFDWAAAMERDAFMAAAMEHALLEEGGFADNETIDAQSEAPSNTLSFAPSTIGGGGGRGGKAAAGSAAVTALWREIAKKEAQRLLRLNDEVSRREAEWQRERDEWMQYRAEVQEEMRRDARNQAKAIRGGAGGEGGSPSVAAPAPAGGQDLAAVKEALRRAQAQALNLKRERANMEGELAKRRQAAAAVEAKLNRLRGALLHQGERPVV